MPLNFEPFGDIFISFCKPSSLPLFQNARSRLLLWESYFPNYVIENFLVPTKTSSAQTSLVFKPQRHYAYVSSKIIWFPSSSINFTSSVTYSSASLVTFTYKGENYTIDILLSYILREFRNESKDKYLPCLINIRILKFNPTNKSSILIIIILTW